jgi:hypothetical protein
MLAVHAGKSLGETGPEPLRSLLRVRSRVSCARVGLTGGGGFQGLAGRVWDGKVSLLHAVAPVAVACKEQLQAGTGDFPPADEVVRTVVAECRRPNPVYRLAALQALAKLLTGLDFVDAFGTVRELLLPIIRSVDEAPAAPQQSALAATAAAGSAADAAGASVLCMRTLMFGR